MMWSDRELAEKREQRAQLCTRAAKLAGDPAAGPFLFGLLASQLEDLNCLSLLDDAADTAEAFAASMSPQAEQLPAEPVPYWPVPPLPSTGTTWRRRPDGGDHEPLALASL